MLMPILRFSLVFALALTAACDERFPAELFDSRTPRERYEDGLRDAGLAGAALARDWLGAAERALADAPPVSLPHVEDGYLDPAAPVAFAWRFEARRGQEVTAGIDWRGSPPALVFIEIWRVKEDSSLDRVAAADSGSSTLVYEPRRSGEYVIRIQPELMRGGRFRITLRAAPTLAFPVQGGTNDDIGSLYGVPRDGGRRRHQGIDVFARRGTPALAAGAAMVVRVEEDRLGGLVVWLRDRRGNSLYYAHLDTQLVREGDAVEAGDTVGLVGNTGNARRTPAHLHFSVYRRGEGPLDPYWFVARTPARPIPVAVDTAALGRWARTRSETALLAAPDARAPRRLTLERHSALQLTGAAGGWYRVRLPGGESGYLRASAVQEPAAAIGRIVLEQPAELARRPAAPPHDVLDPGSVVAILARSERGWLVRTESGTTGWITLSPAVSRAD